MPLQVLIAPDKFKGTLTAHDAAKAIARGWARSRPDDTLAMLPISDGGDGFGEVLSGLMGARPRVVSTVDAAHRPCNATWWWHEPTATAIIESAQAVGLARLPHGKYHPFELDTEGLGVLLQAAADARAWQVLIGIGGSATNDGGFGMARALGWRFFNQQSQDIQRWTELRTLSQVRPPAKLPHFESITVAVDVQNPLLGPSGCTRVYGPQKGIRPEDFEFSEQCLEQLAHILRRELHVGDRLLPGTGAAGGLGFGLNCFAGAKLEPGFHLFARYARLEEALKNAQLVITGEGSVDRSTHMGKGVGELGLRCKALSVPCLALAGVAPETDTPSPLFARTLAITPDLASPEKAMAEAAFLLEELAAKAAREWHP